MPAKINIVCQGVTPIHAAWTRPIFEKWFNIIPYDKTKTYSSRDIAFVLDSSEDWSEWSWPKFQDISYESPTVTTSYVSNGQLQLFFKDNWVIESAMWKYFGYNNYMASLGGDKFFLMLMHMVRPHRELLFRRTSHLHESSLVSYVARGIHLEGDMEYRLPTTSIWQRYCNMDWYNCTNFSVVAESYVTGLHFHSEKTFKPIAFGHPFVIYGTPGILNYLKSQGFATYDHIINESYDNIKEQSLRLSAITKELNRLFEQFKEGSLFVDRETQQKAEHNHHTFFNDEKVEQIVYQQLALPLLEYINA